MSASAPPSFDQLPGAELITAGLADLAAGRETIGSLLVIIALPRLAGCGVAIPEIPAHALDAEIRLYYLLGEQHGDEAYAQYNSLLRRLVSFCRALEGRVVAGGSAP
jgi:hypothetical protein